LLCHWIKVFRIGLTVFCPALKKPIHFHLDNWSKLKLFSPCDFFKLISKRLGHRKWPGTTDDFIEQDAFWALMLSTGGHPRRAFAVLREAMELIAAKNGKKNIRLEHIRAAVDECGENWQRLKCGFPVFGCHGPHSSSDDKFKNAAGIGRTQLRTRLASFKKRVALVEEESSGM